MQNICLLFLVSLSCAASSVIKTSGRNDHYSYEEDYNQQHLYAADPALELEIARFLATPQVKPMATLSSDCLNKQCNWMYYFLSCKVFGVDMTKICAEYMMGKQPVIVFFPYFVCNIFL